jgi:hypothetical protein
VLSLPCSDAATLISRSMDETLPRHQRLAMRLHFVSCKVCRRYKAHLLQVRAALRRFPGHLTQPTKSGAFGTAGLTQPARDRMKAALNRAVSDE